MQRSALRCSCHLKIHSERCKLHLLSRTDKWWPGADLKDDPVSRDDKRFLERVSPAWWVKEHAVPLETQT